jgi:ribosomal protein S18 acetylase RimI-like enzyme
MRTLHGHEVLEDVDHLAGIYGDVFTSAPWNEGPDDVAAFRRRLARDAGEPGFRTIITGDGFAAGWRTTLPLPPSRAYPQVVSHLGQERVTTLLDGALVVDELAVRAGARRSGLGRRLLAELVGSDRAWLLTSMRAPAAIEFYRRVGWRQIQPSPGVESTLAVFVTL